MQKYKTKTLNIMQIDLLERICSDLLHLWMWKHVHAKLDSA